MPMALARYLRAFVVRQRRIALLTSAGWATAFLLGWVLVACVIDRFVQLPGAARLVLLIAGLTGAAVILARQALRTFARIDYGAAAARVEQVNPVFGERLRTVVSQSVAPGRASGSSDMLGRLTDEVLQEIAVDRPAQGIRWSGVRRAWGTAGVVLVLTVLIGLAPTLEMPRLVKRLALPLAHVPPVTTTRIDVRPGNISLNRGEPLEIRARVERLARGGVDVYTSEDGGSTWSRVPMLPVGEDEYVFSLSAVQRGLRYYLSGGDATTETFAVEVLRAPAVVEYHVRYEYPLYTERSPVSVTSNDGVIDAVIGTRVRVQVVATEPLESAVLSLGSERRVMAVTSEPRIAEAQFEIERPGRADLELRSKGGLSSGTIRDALTINAVADREPIVRVLQPLDDLRLHPRDVVGVQYQAMDDYGVMYLAAVVQTSSGGPRELPIRRRGDLRRQEGEYFLDLAMLDLRMGDVVTLCLLAQDGLGRRVQTESRNVLISPRSIDINTYLRIAEMRQAGQLAATARDELRESLSALGEAKRRGERPDTASAAREQLAARSRAGEGLTNAVESSLLSRQALLRAIAKSDSAAQTFLLARYVDRISVQIAELERASSMDAAGEREAIVERALRPLVEPAARIATEVKTIGDAEQATAILAERANVRAPSTRPADPAAAERLAETLRRAEQEIAGLVGELGLDPDGADVDAALRRIVDAGARLARGADRPQDFAAAAEAWVAQLRRSAMPLPPLAERLAAAASVEAVRPDANPVIARDLQLASRATSRLTQSMLTWPEADRVFIPHPVDEYPMALRSVQREHALLRAAAGAGAATLTSPEAEQAARDGAAGRARLAEWATRVESSTGSEIAGEIMDEEELAMIASAETAMRNYDAAALMDRRLAEGASAAEDTGRIKAIGVALEAVQEIDRLAADQKNLAAQTAGLHDEERAAAMAGDQARVAREIGAFRSEAGGQPIGSGSSAADSRRRATEAVQRVQEQLTHMPQRLTVAQEAAEAYRLAVERADQARWRAEGVDEEQRPAAERAVEVADRAAREAGERMNSAVAHVSVDVVKRMAADLQPFEPETGGAVAALTGQLASTAESFERAARGGERVSVVRAAQRVRGAIESAQGTLSDAQARLIEDDPVVSAHWFAEAAARALAERPPDVPKAHRHQKTAAAALDRAWQGAVRDVSTERLALAPGYRAILRPGSSGTAGAPSGGVFRPFGDLLPGLRQWGFLRSQTADSLAAPVQETEAPGYQDQLRVYFDTLSKAHKQQSSTN